MRNPCFVIALLLSLLAAPAWSASPQDDGAKTRIAIVSSYHRDYLWSQETNRGVVAALLEHGYLDSPSQGETFTREDFVESSEAVIKKLWMDTKRQNSRAQIAQTVVRVVSELDEFRPDLLLLGDDNATNYIGNQYVDTDLDIVFWGVNGNPLKYDLIDALERPGHNVTGVYQAGYLREGVEWLNKLLPQVRTMAVLSDASPTGRSKAKELARLARDGALPVELVATVVTDSFATWKNETLALRNKVDAFFVLNHNTLKDDKGQVVDPLEAGAWYLRHVGKPEVTQEKQFVVEGMLSAVDDSGYKQAFEAVEIAHRILAKAADPAQIPVRAPGRGPFVVNLERAKMLGIQAHVEKHPLVEDRVETALALRDRR